MAGRHRKPAVRGRHRRPTSHGRYLATGVAAVAVLGIGGVGAHAALSGGSGGSPPAAAPAGTSTTPAATLPPVGTPPPTPVATSSSHVPSAKSPSVALALTVTGQVSWVEVTRPNGHVLVSGLIRHDRRLAFRHGRLRVTIGDAGAVRLVRHGHVHAPAGRPGQVLRFTVHSA